MKIKAWIPIKKIQLPSKPEQAFEWFHIIEDTDTFKAHRNLCCLFFNLDMTDKSQKSKLSIVLALGTFSLPYLQLLIFDF